MKYSQLIIFLLIILVFSSGVSCKLFFGVEKPPSDKSVPKNINLSRDVIIYLNNEEIGKIKEANELAKRTLEIKKAREERGVFAEGSAEINFQVYFKINSNISLQDLEKMQISSITIPKKSIKTISYKDPLILYVVVQNKNYALPHLPNYESFNRTNEVFNISIDNIENKLKGENLKKGMHEARTFVFSSLEISSSGEYFVNKAYSNKEIKNYGSTENLEVRQKKVNKTDLKTELLNLTENGKKPLKVLANNNLDYYTLKEVLDIMEDTKLNEISVTLIPQTK